MSILNRRNAFLGWVVWEAGKRIAKRKAKSVVPAGDSGRNRKRSLLAALLAAVAGMLMFWRRRGARATSIPD